MHHVKDEKKLVLNKWLREETPNNLPAYATHNVGAGGIIFN